LLTSARQNYDAIAKKSGQYAAYPGDWLYTTWSESDLKEFLDARGLPSPQPTTRDKLIASVRRNARLASLNMLTAASSASKSASSASSVASASAASAQAGLSDALLDAWSDSKLKEFLDEHGIPVPQGSKKNELIALARKHRASLTDSASTASASGASAFGAATSSAGNAYAKATDDAPAKAEDLFQSAVNTWSDSRLKAYLDARGVPVPQGGKRDQLIASVRLNKHKAASGWSVWTFDTWTVENLQNYLAAHTKKYKKSSNVNREELIKSAQSVYSTASKSGGSNYASVTSYLSQQTDAVKDSTFETWSDSELKSYLDSYGVPNYQGSTTNELRALAKKQYTYFKYGTSTPSGTIFERIKEGFVWGLAQLQGGASSGSSTASSSASSAASVASKSASSASSVASKHASSAKKEL
jgi:Putative nuclear envelope organisation protein